MEIWIFYLYWFDINCGLGYPINILSIENGYKLRNTLTLALSRKRERAHERQFLIFPSPCRIDLKIPVLYTGYICS